MFVSTSALAQQFAAWVRADARFELAAPVPLNLICFRLRSGDADNQKLMDTLNQSGDLYLSHTKLDDKFTLRLCVGQTQYRSPPRGTRVATDSASYGTARQSLVGWDRRSLDRRRLNHHILDHHGA